MPEQDSLAEFKKLLEGKMEIMRKILELTKKQPALMAQDDVTNDLMNNIQKRQELIDALDAIQARVPDMDMIRQDAECARMAADAQQLLIDIQKQDKLNEETALNKMEELREQLRKAKEGQTTFRGYEGSTSRDIGAIYFDKKK